MDDLDQDIPSTLAKQQRARRKHQLRKKKLKEVAQGLCSLAGRASQSKFGQQFLVRRARSQGFVQTQPKIPQLHSAESVEQDEFRRQLDERIARKAQEGDAPGL